MPGSWTLYFWSGLAILLSFCLTHTFTDLDLWGILATGALLIKNPGYFPYIDLFSYTAHGLPWVYHEWGCGFITILLVNHFGSTGLLGLQAILVSAIWWVVWRCFRETPFPALLNENNIAIKTLFIVFFVCWIGLMTAHFLLLRCQLFTDLGYSLFLWLLQRYRSDQRIRHLFGLPLIMLFWANLHGGFVLGFFAVGLFLLSAAWERQWRSVRILGLLLLLCLLATFVNPYGWSFYQQLIPTWTMARVGISEWRTVLEASPLWGSLYTVLCLFFTGLTWAGWMKDRSRFPLGPVMLLLTGIEGWLHFKLSALFFLTAFCLGFEYLPQHFQERTWMLMERYGCRWIKVLFETASISLLITSAYFILNTPSLSLPVTGSDTSPIARPADLIYPMGAVTYLKMHNMQGNVWIPFEWGEFALWNLFPLIKVSVDGRYETVYPQRVFVDNRRFYVKPFDISVLQQYPATDYLLIPAKDTLLVGKITQEFRWHRCYGDEVAILFSKQSDCPVAHKPYSNQTRDLNYFIGDLRRFELSNVRIF